MSDAFLGEIRPFAGNYAPKGWALCNGQTLPITQNTALFSLLGVNFGGNGTTNFGLPNLQGNVPVNQGQGPGLQSYAMGQTGGEINHTLTGAEMPTHYHAMNGSTNAVALTTAPGNYYGSGGRIGSLYGVSTTPTQMIQGVVGANTGGQGHPNQQAYQVVTYIICLQGIYPLRP